MGDRSEIQFTVLNLTDSFDTLLVTERQQQTVVEINKIINRNNYKIQQHIANKYPYLARTYMHNL